MDDEAALSKIDMQAAAAFSGWMAELIHLHLREELSERTAGGATRWDVNTPTLFEITSTSAALAEMQGKFFKPPIQFN